MKTLSIVLAVLLLGAAIGVAQDPIWIWGMGSRPADGPFSDPDGSFEEIGNQWVQEKFGIPGIRAEGSGNLEALRALVASGDVPDVIARVRFNAESVRLLTDLAKDGRLHALDKYFDDPENYPVFASADKGHLRAYRLDGTLYAVPSWVWRIRADDPFSAHPHWMMRLDAYEKYGYATTYDELHELLMNLKNDDFTTLDGSPRIPFGLMTDANMRWPKMVINQGGGAGWEVDAEKRLMPQWASEELYHQLKFFNMLWRDGLMSPGAFLDPGAFEGDLAAGQYSVMAGHGGYSGAGYRDHLTARVDQLGPDHEDVKTYQAQAIIMMLPPITDNPGRYTGNQSSFNLIMANNPYPDETMKLLDWMFSDEGVISTFVHVGQMGVDWEPAPPPLYWTTLPDGFHGPSEPGTQHKRVNNLWESGYTDPETGEKAGRFPKLFPLASPAYASWVERLNFEQMEHQRTHYGMLIPSEPYDSGVPGGVEWGQPYSQALAAFTSPIPSYAQVAEVLPPLEATALASAEQKYNTGLVTVLTAGSEDEFQAAYDEMIASLIDTARWRRIYEDRTERWVAWLESNGIDDRAELKSVTPIAAWKEVMGW
jgi:muconolactone delta-isomerase